MSFVNPKINPAKIITYLLVVIIFHVWLIWLFMNGLTQKITKQIIEPLNATLIEKINHLPKLEKPKPKVVQEVYVPKAEIAPPVSSSGIQVTTVLPPPQVQEAPISPPVTRVVSSAKIDMSGGCQKPQYPDLSRIQGEQGSVTIAFLVSIDGSIKESKILSTSGFSRLDIAARDALKLCRFKPGTENGQPVQSWAEVKYTWRLN